MSYYFAKKLPLDFEDAVRRTAEVLKQQGFGIITETDVKQTLKAKIGVDFRNYRILGACNPKLAHEALQLENKIGTMLPCNVVVQETGNNQTEIRPAKCPRTDDRQNHSGRRGGCLIRFRLLANIIRTSLHQTFGFLQNFDN